MAGARRFGKTEGECAMAEFDFTSLLENELKPALGVTEVGAGI